MSQISRMDVQFSPFPSGFCPVDLNDFGAQLAARLIVTPGLGFSGINIGPTAPSNTDLPWFNTIDNDWYYWSTVAGAWLPVRPVAITGEVEVGSIMFWDGQISLISQVWGDRWLFANGQLVSRTQYPDYFALVGTKWNAGDGSTTFGIIDLTNCVVAGANADTGGQATTTMGDGATPLTQRAYLEHYHIRQVPGSGDGEITQGAVGPYSISRPQDTNAESVAQNIRVLPPFKAGVPLVRVK